MAIYPRLIAHESLRNGIDLLAFVSGSVGVVLGAIEHVQDGRRPVQRCQQSLQQVNFRSDGN